MSVAPHPMMRDDRSLRDAVLCIGGPLDGVMRQRDGRMVRALSLGPIPAIREYPIGASLPQEIETREHPYELRQFAITWACYVEQDLMRDLPGDVAIRKAQVALFQ